MRKITLLFIVILITLLLIPLSTAEKLENLYQYDSLEMELMVNGEFTLVPEKQNAKVREVTTELQLVPENTFRQSLQNMKTTGTVAPGMITYEWNNPEQTMQQFGYTAKIKTSNKRHEVRTKIPYPILSIPTELEEYTQPSEKIDSNHPAIINKAASLAEGEDDLFEVAFNLASWVEEYVTYDLNTLTASVSQKASWVFENKQGVCDEMTALFIAMARSLGIPARFVKGISYTTSDLFTENWQPHGWAEVYFPNLGWVSFDITFGEYGYVDVTHIKLKDSIDPGESDTKHRWIADGVKLETKPLQLKVNVISKGIPLPEETILEEDILSKEVGLGSYNLVKGTVTSKESYYTATTLQLATPKEIEILGRNKRKLLLTPYERRETYWIVHVPASLENRYIYQFPMMLHSEKGISVQNSFSAQDGKTIYSQEEIEKLTVQEKEKKYSGDIYIFCNYPPELLLHQQAAANCTVHNKRNANLDNIKLCFNENCETIELPINQKINKQVSVPTNKIGWNKLFVSVINGIIEKKSALEYVVLDEPAVDLIVNTPQTIQGNEPVEIAVTLDKTSFNTPLNVRIKIKGPGISNTWQLEKLDKQEIIVFQAHAGRFGSSNKITIEVLWESKQNSISSTKKVVTITKTPRNSADKIIIGIMNVINAIL